MQDSDLAPDSPNVQVAVMTLTLGGFTLDSADRHPGYALLYAHRYDEFGISQQYCFALCEAHLETDYLSALRAAAKHHHAQLVTISPDPGAEAGHTSWNRFVGLLGGPVYDYLPLEAGFGDRLKQLAHNALPQGLNGRPDELFELYAHKALEFILACKVRRYGQERRFEARPDGLILQRSAFSALYDAKAYSSGYDVTQASLRQFLSYVTDFRNRYSAYFDLNAFVVISGSFLQSARALEDRSREFLSQSGVPLIFLDAETLVQIIKAIAAFPAARPSINWRKVFVNPVTRIDHVTAELDLVQRDKILGQQKE